MQGCVFHFSHSVLSAQPTELQFRDSVGITWKNNLTDTVCGRHMFFRGQIFGFISRVTWGSLQSSNNIGAEVASLDASYKKSNERCV